MITAQIDMPRRPSRLGIRCWGLAKTRRSTPPSACLISPSSRGPLSATVDLPPSPERTRDMLIRTSHGPLAFRQTTAKRLYPQFCVPVLVEPYPYFLRRVREIQRPQRRSPH